MKRLKTYIPVLAIIFVLLFTQFTKGEEKSIRVFVNNKQVESEAKMIDGTVYVPIEEIGKSLGAVANWDPETNTVNISGVEDAIPEVLARVNKSVVGIIGTLKKSSMDYSPYGDNLIFGTGVIIEANGFIITNAHVVKEMESMAVVLSNGKAYEGRLKALDETSDLAMIKIDKGGLKPVVFGEMSKVVVGQPVVAIGTPLSFSLMNSVSKGIVSGINRSVDGEYRFIQSDAAINGGNSGGPMVNMAGEVIGINTVKYMGLGVEGLSFSIPVDTVQYVIGHFKKYGKVRRPYLGVDFLESVAARYGLPSEEGLTVSEVLEDSPAKMAGLMEDDVIIAVNDVRITTKIDYNEEMKKYLPGDKALLKIERDGAVKVLEVVFGEME